MLILEKGSNQHLLGLERWLRKPRLQQCHFLPGHLACSNEISKWQWQCSCAICKKPRSPPKSYVYPAISISDSSPSVPDRRQDVKSGTTGVSPFECTSSSTPFWVGLRMTSVHSSHPNFSQLQSMPLQRDSLTTSVIFLLPLLILALIAAFNMATKQSNHNLNGEHCLPSMRWSDTTDAILRETSFRSQHPVEQMLTTYPRPKQSSKSRSPSSPKNP